MTAELLRLDDHAKRQTTGCRMHPVGPTPAQVQRMTQAVWTLAMYAARAAAREDFKRQNRRLCDVEAREITAAAKALLDARPNEFVTEARKLVAFWHAQGRWGPRGGFRSR